MSNRSWLILFLGIVALFTGDIFISDGETLLFLGRRVLVLIEWIAFWR
ncbi:MAG: glyceraldehyde-3-phosphate dehydrogenase [Rhodobacteraceae bacterium]|nr:MAG: glyceraldehyde-3-phosphate dehydrogenase [Paracoccaceae bacterium]